MSTEKDGTQVPPPPDASDTDEGDVTNVKEVVLPKLPGEETMAGEATTVKKAEAPRMPGLTMTLPPEEEGPQGLGSPEETQTRTQVQEQPPAQVEPEEVAAADVEEISDVEVLEEEMAPAPPATVRPLLEIALADAQNLL